MISKSLNNWLKWCGLAPGLNESAGKKSPCGITKQGSKISELYLWRLLKLWLK